jgi:hypothetical protein
MFRAVMWVVTVIFAGITVMALQQVGYIGIFTGQFTNWGTAQVLADLIIACCLLMGWIWRDARATVAIFGRNTRGRVVRAACVSFVDAAQDRP